MPTTTPPDSKGADPMTTPKPTEAYTAEELNELLRVGARITGTHTAAAAIHLLTYTELPGRASFARLVEVAEERDLDGGQVTAAFVTDWKALPPAAGYLTGGDARLVAVAASLAAGEPVDLREQLTGLGHAYACRVVEAVLIATGYDDWYAVTNKGAAGKTTATINLAGLLNANDGQVRVVDLDPQGRLTTEPEGQQPR